MCILWAAYRLFRRSFDSLGYVWLNCWGLGQTYRNMTVIQAHIFLSACNISDSYDSPRLRTSYWFKMDLSLLACMQASLYPCGHTFTDSKLCSNRMTVFLCEFWLNIKDSHRDMLQDWDSCTCANLCELFLPLWKAITTFRDYSYKTIKEWSDFLQKRNTEMSHPFCCVS